MTSCTLCGKLPDDVTVNTGRDHYFQEEFYKLTKLGGALKEPFRRCPKCHIFFHWIDHPQMYGSGNCDEEQAIRLSPRVSALLDELFPSDPKNPPHLSVEEFFDPAGGLPIWLLVLALEGYAFKGPKLIAPFVPRLVQILNATNDSSIGSLLSNYRYGRPEQAQEILFEIQLLGEVKLSYSAQHLKDRCLEILEKKS